MTLNPEDSLLKVLLVDNQAYWQISEIICPDDLTPKARKIYEAIAAAAKSGPAVDFITIGEVAGPVIGQEAMDIACNSSGVLANIASYAHAVSARGEAKRVREAGHKIMAASSFAEAQELLAAVRPQQMIKAKTVRDGLNEMLEAAQRRAAGPYGLTWGVPGVDQVAGRLAPARLYGIAGRAKMGKTTLSLPAQIRAVLGLPEKEIKPARVLNFSLEMTAGELVQAALANVGNFSATYFEREDGVPDEAWAYIHEAAKRLNEAPWLIDDTPALTMEQIESRAIQHHMQEPLSLIVVDHIGLVRLPHRKGASHSDELGEVSYGLKNLAKRLNVPVIALLQLNRNLESRPDKRPNMADIRDSGNIEQDCDCIVSIYRDEVYNPNSPDKGHAEISTMANRHGRGGTAFVSVDLDKKTYGEPAKQRHCFPAGSNSTNSGGGGFADSYGQSQQSRPVARTGGNQGSLRGRLPDRVGSGRERGDWQETG